MKSRESSAQRRRRIREGQAAEQERYALPSPNNDPIYTRRADPRVNRLPNESHGRLNADEAARRGKRESQRTARGGTGSGRRRERHLNAEARAEVEADRQSRKAAVARQRAGKTRGTAPRRQATAGERLPIGPKNRPLELMPGPQSPKLDLPPASPGRARFPHGGSVPEQWWEVEGRAMKPRVVEETGELSMATKALWRGRKAKSGALSTIMEHKGKSALAAGVIVGGLAFARSTHGATDKVRGRPTGIYGY